MRNQPLPAWLSSASMPHPLHIALSSVPWTCKFILCTCYFFQQDYSSFISLHACLPPFHHSGLSSNVTFSKRPSLTPYCKQPLPPSLPSITSLCFDIIALIAFWFYLVDLSVCLLSDSSFYTAGALFLIHFSFWHSPIKLFQLFNTFIQKLCLYIVLQH